MRTQKLKIIIDILLVLGLLFLMPYEMVGDAAHEWIGIGLFLLLIGHHVMNKRWTTRIGKGKYTAFRIVQTMLVALVMLCMIGSMISGIMLSRYVFDFLNIRGFSVQAGTVHMICAYWGFILMSLHLGIHWGVFVSRIGKLFNKPSAIRMWIARFAGAAIAIYGLYAFLKRNILSYMFMQVHFVFFDYTEPVVYFILDYAAVMGMVVFIGHYLSRGLIKVMKKKVK